jgi:hypothetical protein
MPAGPNPNCIVDRQDDDRPLVAFAAGGATE